MLYLLVQVNENLKSIISEHVVSIESESNQFYDLFDAITSRQYNYKEVLVFIRREKSESWRKVDNGLNGDLKILEGLDHGPDMICNNIITYFIPCWHAIVSVCE